MTRAEPLMASVPAPAALWLLRWVNGSRPGGPDMLQAAAQFERNGQPAVGRALRFAYGQLEQSADLLKLDEVLPRIGSAEVAGSEMAAGSGAAGVPPRPTLTVAKTAKDLDLTPRQVINLLHNEVLVGSQPGGRGCAWEIDRQSVYDLREARRLA
jgi:hypothetical protein